MSTQILSREKPLCRARMRGNEPRNNRGRQEEQAPLIPNGTQTEMRLQILEHRQAGKMPNDDIVFRVSIVFLPQCKKLFHFAERDFIGRQNRCLLLLLICYVPKCNKM